VLFCNVHKLFLIDLDDLCTDPFTSLSVTLVNNVIIIKTIKKFTFSRGSNRNYKVIII